jgi:cyanophycin synthetase
VSRAIGAGGRLVLNADDPVLASAAARLEVPIAWFSLDPAGASVPVGTTGAVVEHDIIVLREGGRRETIAPVRELPLAMGGAARHNVANALAAVAAAGKLGVSAEVARDTLRRFGRDPSDNPGRANLLEAGGIRILVDYAHNPHGMRALAAAAASIPAERRLVLLGQAGDRSDSAIRELAGAALALRPDRVIVKEMERYLRGRAPGEVPGILTAEFRRLGMPADRVTPGGPEPAAVREALAWARPGDLLVLALHQDRAEVIALIERLRAGGWTAGEPLPASP